MRCPECGMPMIRRYKMGRIGEEYLWYCMHCDLVVNDA